MYLPIVVLSVYFLLIYAVSHFSARDTSNKTYFLANKRAPWYIVSLGMVSASLSGVTFVSVPGWVVNSHFSYMQMVLGFIPGYILIALLLLPLYYKVGGVSIYAYFKKRFGEISFQTATGFFLLSKFVSVIIKGYFAIFILQRFVFAAFEVPFALTVFVCMLIIYLYTFRKGVGALVWTDFIQTICIVASIVLIIFQVKNQLGFSVGEMTSAVLQDTHSQIFTHGVGGFIKQFLSGAFIVVAMTGLDQDLMQKNLSCQRLKDSQKNMYWNSVAYLPINFLLLALGVLLMIYAQRIDFTLPQKTDEILPLMVSSGLFGSVAISLFSVGVVAATFSTLDSSIVALTTTLYVNVFNFEKKNNSIFVRQWLQLLIVVFVSVGIIVVNKLATKSILDLVYTAVSYTTGPLLGMYAFGMFTKVKLRDRWVPIVAVLSPILTFLIQNMLKNVYDLGYLALVLNGFITFVGLLIIGKYGNKEC